MSAVDEVVWARESISRDDAPRRFRHRMKPIVKISSTAAVGQLRVGLWLHDERVVGWWLPFVAEMTDVVIDSVARRVFVGPRDAEREVVHNYVRGWNGGPLGFGALPRGVYTLTVDQEEGHHVPVRVEVLVAQTRGR